MKLEEKLRSLEERLVRISKQKLKTKGCLKGRHVSEVHLCVLFISNATKSINEFLVSTEFKITVRNGHETNGDDNR